MRSVYRVTSVTVVTLLALAGPQLGSRSDATQGTALAAHQPAAEKFEPRKLTAKQRYYKFHPRLVRAARTAVNQRGDRYQWGAEGPKLFDCSGLVYYAYRKAGFRHLPRTSRQQYHHVRLIKKSQLHRGDLMFFRSHGRVYHVAVFLYWHDGRRVFIHSPNAKGRVRKAVPWNNNWRAGTLRPSHKKQHRKERTTRPASRFG